MTRNVARAFRARVKTPPPPPQSFVIQLVPPSTTGPHRVSRSKDARGRRSSAVASRPIMLLRATKTITAMSKLARFCSCWRLRSTVRKTSHSRWASWSSSPFRLLAQPISGAVRTSWPGSSRFNRRGRHYSDRLPGGGVAPFRHRPQTSRRPPLPGRSLGRPQATRHRARRGRRRPFLTQFAYEHSSSDSTGPVPTVGEWGSQSEVPHV